MFASGHTAIFYDYTLRAPVCQSTRTRKMQAVTRKTANSLTSGRRRAIIRVQQQAFALFSPAYQCDHDARHGRLFSFAGLPASREARMRRHMRRISQAEGSAWLSPPSGQIPGWNGVKPAAMQWPTVVCRQRKLNHIRPFASSAYQGIPRPWRMAEATPLLKSGGSAIYAKAPEGFFHSSGRFFITFSDIPH